MKQSGGFVNLKLPLFLRKKRLEVGLSQVAVSKELGYKTPQFVNNWEKGRSSPPLEAVARLIGLYHLDREEILGILLDDARALMVQRLDQARPAKTARRRR